MTTTTEVEFVDRVLTNVVGAETPQQLDEWLLNLYENFFKFVGDAADFIIPTSTALGRMMLTLLVVTICLLLASAGRRLRAAAQRKQKIDPEVSKVLRHFGNVLRFSAFSTFVTFCVSFLVSILARAPSIWANQHLLTP